VAAPLYGQEFQDILARQISRRADQGDFAPHHDGNGIGQFPGEVEILLHQDHPHAAFLGQKRNHAGDILDDIGLNALGRFIQYQQAGARGQRAGNGKLLLLPARQITPRAA
jgi:hypothetical protein